MCDEGQFGVNRGVVERRRGRMNGMGSIEVGLRVLRNSDVLRWSCQIHFPRIS